MIKARIIGVYDSADDAFSRMALLAHTELPQQRLFITTADEKSNKKNLEFVTPSDLLSTTAKAGTVWGALIGLVLGFLYFAVSEGGGAYESTAARLILALLIGAVGGALTGVVISSLATVSASREVNQRLNSRLFTGKHLLVIESNKRHALRARNIIEQHQAAAIGVSN